MDRMTLRRMTNSLADLDDAETAVDDAERRDHLQPKWSARGHLADPEQSPPPTRRAPIG